MIGENDVKKVANLARLELSAADTQRMTTELGSIFGYVEQITKLKLADVSATSHAFGVTNVMREDIIQTSLTDEDLKLNAPETSGRYIKVPLIVE